MYNIIKSSRIVEEVHIDDDKNIKITDEEKKYIEKAQKLYEEIVLSGEKKYDQIVDEANKKADKFIGEAYDKSKEIFENAQKEGYKKGYDEGFNEGYNKAYDNGKNDADKIIDEALSIKDEYLNIKNNVYEEIEKDVIELVFTICEKIINEKLEDDRETIISLVLKGLDNAHARGDIIIRVSKEDFDIVEMSKEKILANATMIDKLEVKLDGNLKRGDCIIETSKGNVDVSVEYQLNEVKELLNNILNAQY